MKTHSLTLPLPAATAAPPRRIAWWRLLAVLAVVFVWLGATAGLRPLTLPDEGRYVGVALEMLHADHSAVPTLAGLPFFHKPPLFYWITEASLRVFGVTQWAARLASVLGATLGALALYLLVRRRASERVARLVLLGLLTQPLWFLGAQFANMDMLVAGCISATIALLAHAAWQWQDGLPWRRTLLAAYVCAALGVLAKGLIGAVIPALVMLAWLGAQKRWRTIVALLWLPGMAAFALVAAPWFVRMQSEFPGFLHYFIVVQHVQRFAQSGFNNAQPVWFYPAVLVLLSLPWIVWLGRAALRAYWQRVAREPLLLLMWVWLATVVVFFSLPQSKLVGYVLPAVPPLAFLMVDAALPLRRSRLFGSAAVSALVCLGAVTALTIHPPLSNRELGQALAAQRQPAEPIVFVDDYYYDLAFYAGTRTPALVADDWGKPELRQADNWRHEVADAAAFSPAVAARQLIDAGTLNARLCSGSPRAWLVVTHAVESRYPFLQSAERVASNKDAALWRVDRGVPAMARALGCR